MKTFLLNREKDKTGVSGTGIIAEGVCFSDGFCVLRWLGNTPSTVVYSSLEDLLFIHDHKGEGYTKIVWKDKPKESG